MFFTRKLFLTVKLKFGGNVCDRGCFYFVSLDLFLAWCPYSYNINNEVSFNSLRLPLRLMLSITVCGSE